MSGSPRKAALELRSHAVTAFAAVGSGKLGLDNLADMQELDDPPRPMGSEQGAPGDRQGVDGASPTQ